MKRINERLMLWKKDREIYDFQDFALDLKNHFLIDELERNRFDNFSIEHQIDFSMQDLRVMVGDLTDAYQVSLDVLSDNIFINIDTSKLNCLYEIYPKHYELLYVKLVDFFVEIFEKIEILVNHYGEKNIYFNDLEELYSDFSFYESYILQIENLISEIESNNYLSDIVKGQLLCKLIPVEIINIDYFLSINKYFSRGKFTSYGVEENLKKSYIIRFNELCEMYQKIINLKIVIFPSAKDVIDMKIKQMNIKNKYNIETDKYIIPEL